jgi:outer membrane receptor protein involved in Fe transport
MERIGASQLSDFLHLSPGVGIVDAGDGSQAIQIRGISAFAGDATIGYYLDELPFTAIGVAAVPDVRMFDIERVEVLRGPQGTLYGDGSIGGTVRILTTNPNLNRFEAKGDVFYSSTNDGGDSYGVKGAVNVPLVAGMLGLRLVGSYEDFSGWVDAPALNTFNTNDRQIQNYRGKLLFQPTDRLRLTLSAWKVREDVGASSASLGNRTNLRVVPPMNFLDYKLYSGVLEYDFGAFQLLSASSYMDYNREATFEFIRMPAVLRTPLENFTQEVRLTSSGAGSFLWTAGAFYRDLKSDQFAELPIFGTQFQKANSKSWAVFGEGTQSFLDNTVKATIGLRYFEDDRQRQDVGFQPVGTTHKTLNPRFNLSYQPNRDWITYLNVAKGFRSGQTQAGAVLAIAKNMGLDVPVAIDPETLWTYELGTKWSGLSGAFTLEAAVYRNDWKDMQLPVSVVPNAIAALLNVGEARVIGLDLVATVRPSRELTVSFSGNINEAEIRKDVLDFRGIAFKKGARIPGVPAHSANFAATYLWPLDGGSERRGGLRGLIHGDLQYNSDRPGGGIGVARASDHHMQINARVGIENDRWGLYLFGTNLTDENTALEAITLSGNSTRPRPRTLGVNLRARY